MPSAAPAACLHILEAYIETLKAENESLKRQLADAEKRSARETAKAERSDRGVFGHHETDHGAAARARQPWLRITAKRRAGAQNGPGDAIPPGCLAHPRPRRQATAAGG
jgi:hypothetical protein